MPFPKDLLIFDLEATGSNVMIYGLAQIGAVKVCNRCLKIYDWFVTLTRPLDSDKIREKSMNVHKIPLEVLMKAPPLEEALESFEKWMKPNPKIYLPASWGGWDTHFLMGTYGKTNRRYPLTGKSLDIKSIVYYEYAKHKDRIPTGGLAKMSQKLGLRPMENQHDALADAIRTTELLSKVWITIRCKRHRQ